MALITKINGVTKTALDTTIRYDFPRAAITVDIARQKILIRKYGDSEGEHHFIFDELSDNFGTADAEGYVDHLAQEGFFETASSGDDDDDDTSLTPEQTIPSNRCRIIRR